MSLVTPSLLIFDCDGVLIDSELLACRSGAASLSAIGVAITAEDIAARYVGMSTAAMFADIEARTGSPLPGGFVEDARRRLAQTFEAELKPMPGIEAALAALDARKCVASSSSPERLRHTLSLAGLLHHFEPHIFSATQVERGKPAPDLFLFAAERMRVEPRACLVIEDSVPGVAAARAAGMPVIGFTGGSHCGPGHAERLRQTGASRVIATFDDLPACIRSAAES